MTKSTSSNSMESVRIPDASEPQRAPDGVEGDYVFWLGADGELYDPNGDEGYEPQHEFIFDEDVSDD